MITCEQALATLTPSFEKLITFYIKEPRADVRGQAFRLGNDFFTVPKNSKVTFGKPR